MDIRLVSGAIGVKYPFPSCIQCEIKGWGTGCFTITGEFNHMRCCNQFAFAYDHLWLIKQQGPIIPVFRIDQPMPQQTQIPQQGGPPKGAGIPNNAPSSAILNVMTPQRNIAAGLLVRLR